MFDQVVVNDSIDVAYGELQRYIEEVNTAAMTISYFLYLFLASEHWTEEMSIIPQEVLPKPLLYSYIVL